MPIQARNTRTMQPARSCTKRAVQVKALLTVALKRDLLVHVSCHKHQPMQLYRWGDGEDGRGPPGTMWYDPNYSTNGPLATLSGRRRAAPSLGRHCIFWSARSEREFTVPWVTGACSLIYLVFDSHYLIQKERLYCDVALNASATPGTGRDGVRGTHFSP